jgi:hypothetical protein
MYPTLFVGCIMLVAAARFAIGPQRGRLAPIVGRGGQTTIGSSPGGVVGVLRTFIGSAEMADAAERGGVVVMGVGESLHNIAFGLVLLVLATTGVVVGLARRPAKADGAQLVDPHAG